jgi:peptidoglycan hydrolase-like protein with peptidoglycan-binding domain
VVYLDTGTASTPSQTPSQTAAPYAFVQNHQLYDVSSDIRALQQWLNAHAFPLATNGPGAPGQETSKFGALTLKALLKFQKAKGLPATGYFGPLTRAAIANILP